MAMTVRQMPFCLVHDVDLTGDLMVTVHLYTAQVSHVYSFPILHSQSFNPETYKKHRKCNVVRYVATCFRKISTKQWLHNLVSQWSSHTSRKANAKTTSFYWVIIISSLPVKPNNSKSECISLTLLFNWVKGIYICDVVLMVVARGGKNRKNK